MHLSKLPAGSRVFVDANVMVYFFLRVEPFAETCKDFFHRVANLEIEAFTGADVAGTVVHRVMVAEAITKFGLQPREAVNYLKTHPDAVKQLQRYKTIPSDMAQARVRILDVTYRELHASNKYHADHGLLTADSIILAVMERHKLSTWSGTITISSWCRASGSGGLVEPIPLSRGASERFSSAPQHLGTSAPSFGGGGGRPRRLAAGGHRPGLRLQQQPAGAQRADTRQPGDGELAARRRGS